MHDILEGVLILHLHDPWSLVQSKLSSTGFTQKKKKKIERELGMEVLHTVSPLPNKPLILIKMYVTILRLFNLAIFRQD